MKRQCRIFALFTAFIMIVSLMQTGYAMEQKAVLPEAEKGLVKTATDVLSTKESDSPVKLEGSTLYTYGTPVVIKKDSADGKAYVYDGSGTDKLLDTAVSSPTIYGGGKNETVTGDVSITVESVNVGTIYGGGCSDGSHEADVDGNVSITIKGSADAFKVYGGGCAKSEKGDASASVTGKAVINIPAVPIRYHNNIYGGGTATAYGNNNACADVGAVSIYVNGSLYSVRGGGTANIAAGATGSARADVKGTAQIRLKDVDVREIYGAGYAEGERCQAKTGAVDIQVDGNEAMIIRGGGTASSGAAADVTGKVSICMENCWNLYGYLYGGGNASDGGHANTGSVDINIDASVTPVTKQWERWVAHASYGGGEASGSGSQADVSGDINMKINGGEITGNIYGGGEASTGGSARAGDVKVTLNDIKGYFCSGMGESGEQCYPTVFAAGSSDKSEGSIVEPKSIEVCLTNSTAENLWGGIVDSSGNPGASSGVSNLTLKNSKVTRTVTCFDSITLNKALDITAFLGKKDGVPTQLIDNGIKSGEVIVSCGDRDSEEGWFSLKNGELEYEVTDTASVWKIKTAPGPVKDLEVNNDGSDAKMTVTVKDSAKITEALLTEEDKQDIEDGNTIGFELHSSEVTALAKPVRQAVESAMTENQILASSLDLQLFKVRNGSEAAVTETSAPLQLSINIAEEFLNNDSGKVREFSIVRVHELSDGTFAADVLKDMDDIYNKITIKTDKFSVYSLIYEDKQRIGEKDSDDNNLDIGKEDNNSNGNGGYKNNEEIAGSGQGSKNVGPDNVTIRNRTVTQKTKGAETGDRELLLLYSLICAGALLIVMADIRNIKKCY